jgi:hypothetical protein
VSSKFIYNNVVIMMSTKIIGRGGKHVYGSMIELVRPSLVGLFPALASCYSASGATKHGFFGLIIHFVKREKNDFLLQ